VEQIMVCNMRFASAPKHPTGSGAMQPPLQWVQGLFPHG